MSQDAISRLATLLSQLSVDAKHIDAINKQKKSHYYLKYEPMFDEKLFPIVSSDYIDYVKYAQQRLTHLQKLLKNKQDEFSDALLQELESQIVSLITAIKANQSRHNDSEYRLDRRKRLQGQRQTKQFKKQTKSILQPVNQIYAKLNETRGFELRLMQMLTDKELELKQCKAKDSSRLQMEVLTLHQRLGRCRKAITDIEKQIELSEKRRV